MPVREPATDGRAARALRTRRAIVDALLSLVEEGDLAPTAPRIARRASVSLRSIYQHFEDLEALFAAASARQFERILDLASPLPTEGPLGERLDAFVRQRARVLEALTPVRRAAYVQEPFSAEIREGRRRMEAMARTEVERTFEVELRRLPANERRDVLAGLDAAASWGAWETMRTSGLSVEAARRALRRVLAAVLGEERP
ncbi:MAG TPA: TetR/AcrR family transcriptional regulator [Acidimicrobiales bacterium]|nr:TetR/AcrR family transcriptional regulator [Acidimicrobiales bacterium]